MATKQKTGSYLSATKVAIDYVNELGKNSNESFLLSDFTAEEQAVVSAYEALITAKMNTITPAMERPVYVKYKDETFAISGNNLPLALMKYSDLSAERKVTVDALKAKILAVQGVSMTELYSKLGSNLVTINGVEYPFSDFNEIVNIDVDGIPTPTSVPSPDFVAAIQLATLIYNQL